jgi:prephenate dehydrogenase
VLAFALMNTIGSDPGVLKLAGNGLRDMTRIAASDTVMWRDICLANRDAIAAAVVTLRATLDEVTQAMVSGDAAALDKFLTRARMARRALGDTVP